MKILTLSGSARLDSSNVKLLDAIPLLFPEYEIQRYKKLHELPLFHADLQDSPDPPVVKDWKQALQSADALIICTPEYIHNLPAVLKNALEWVTTSGVLVGKKVLALTFTPNPPRGEKAMQSLIWSLQALDANIVAQLPLFQNEIEFDEHGFLHENEQMDLLKEAINLLN